jgi:hypothetical protein
MNKIPTYEKYVDKLSKYGLPVYIVGNISLTLAEKRIFVGAIS